MKINQLATNRSDSIRFAVARHGIVAICIFVSCIFPVNSQAMLPYFTIDVFIKIYDWVNDEYVEPELAKIISENAEYYLENFAGSSDAALFANDKQVVKYLGMTNMFFGGFPTYIASTNDLYDHEEIFYHSTDPATLVAWRNGVDEVELHWAWDYRFERQGRIFDGNTSIPSADIVRYYRISRKETGGAWVDVLGRLYDAFTEGGTTFTDASLPADWTEVSYKIESWYQKAGEASQVYEYSDPKIAPVVADVANNDLQFWLIRDRLEEDLHEKMRGANPTVADTDIIDWPIKFGVSAAVPGTATLTLEMYEDYKEVAGVWTEVKTIYNNLDTTSVAGEVSTIVSLPAKYMLDSGGFIYRLHYVDGPQDTYFPETQPYVDYPSEPRIHLIRSSVNNRVMGNTWHNYQVRIEGAEQAWRAKYIEIVNEYEAGLTPPNHPMTSYDAVFLDSAVGNYSEVHNTVRGYEYVSDASFHQANIDFVLGVDLGTNVDIFANCFDVKMLEAIAPSPNVSGYMSDNLCVQPSGFFNLMATAMWIGRTLPTERMWYFTGGFDFRVPNPGDLTETGPDLRKQCLVTYLILKNDPSVGENIEPLFGYGEWISDDGSGDTNPDLINIVPEQFLGFLEPIPGSYPTAFGDAAAFLAAKGSDPKGWVAGNTALEKGGRFWVREYEYENGVEGGSPSRAWAILDFDWQSSGSQSVNFTDIIPNASQSVYYRLQLENEIVDVTKGAYLETEAFSADGDPWLTSERLSVVIFEQPIESPTIGTNFYDSHAAMAEYSLPVSDTVSPVFALPVSQWNGEVLSEVRIALDRATFNGTETTAFSALYGSANLILNDSNTDGDRLAGDGIYSALLPPMASASIAIGTYQFPVIVTGTDGLMRFGTVTAQVSAMPNLVFSNESSSTGDLANSSGPALPYESASFNLNGDGFPDLFVSQNFETSPGIFLKGQLYLGVTIDAATGTPVFSNATDITFALGERPVPGQGVAFSDFDGDGDIDFYLAAYSTGASPITPQLFVYDKAALRFVDESGAVFNAIAGGTFDADWGDYNDDGLLDLVVARSPFPEDGGAPQGGAAMPAGASPGGGSEPFLYRHYYDALNDEHTLVLQTSSIFPDDLHYSYEVSFVDVNNDNNPDIFISDLYSTQSSALMINRGQVVGSSDSNEFWFTDDTAAWFPAGSLPLGVRSAAFLQEGGQVTDLVTSSWGQEDNLTVYHKNGSAFEVADKTSGYIPVEPLSLNGLVAGDFDGNGLDDILVLPYLDSQEPYILLNGIGGGSGVFSKLPSLSFGTGRANGAVIADWGLNTDTTEFTGDGDLDIYFGRGASAGNFFYVNTSPAQSGTDWLEISLKSGGGEAGNGLGATVELLDATNDTKKKMVASGGRGGAPAELLFPLFNHSGSTIDVKVTWPSGHVQVASCLVGRDNVIKDDSYLIDSSTVAFSYQPSPTGTDWTFEWTTVGPTPAHLDFVHLVTTTDMSSPCFCVGVIDLDDSMSSVDVTITKESNGWKHTLVWHDGCCAAQKPSCSISYDVHSANNLGNDSSTNHTFSKFKICGSGF